MKHGNVGGLFTNVTHGVSDSAAKVTGSLSDGLGIMVMDEKHMEIRENIRRTRGQGTGEQFMAGVKGLGTDMRWLLYWNNGVRVPGSRLSFLVWAAAPKGAMSYRIGGFCPYVRPYVPP